MGHALGATLRQHGLRILTSLAGRSERTRWLAQQAGFEDAGSLEDLVQQADAVLCILVPSEALGVAERVAMAVTATGADLLYADCNAVAPRTARTIGQVIMASGARFADGGIIGLPPGQQGTPPRIYTSGPGARELAQLAQHGLDIRVLNGEVGQASGIKMCYGALTKGLQALGMELLVAAKLMSVDEPLRAEQAGTLAGVLQFLQGAAGRMPPKAYRWVGEMEEIATCFADLGMTPRILRGAADMYRFIASTPIGQVTPEDPAPDRDLDGIAAALAEAIHHLSKAAASGAAT
jgi:3-hydroxyisobutyrate dehydrogenase-like beta-hydroxyacid dehydrogenase